MTIPGASTLSFQHPLLKKTSGSFVSWIIEDNFGDIIFHDNSTVHKHHPLATSRAKPISWVTTSMVSPLLARFFITLSTSPTNSGSRALEARQTAGLLVPWKVPGRWPPAVLTAGDPVRLGFDELGHTYQFQIFHGSFSGRFDVFFQNLDLPNYAIIKH